MRNVTECQRRLIQLGYLAATTLAGAPNDDGKFGGLSLDAYNHYRASKGLGPVVQTSMSELNSVLFPEDVPATPIHKPGLAENLSTIFNVINLLKGKTMTKDQIGGIVRAVLSAIAGYFVGKGVIDADTAAVISGAIGTLAVTAWSVWTNRPAKIGQ